MMKNNLWQQELYHSYLFKYKLMLIEFPDLITIIHM
jgi:hypothetical protein